jgi:hypothetical protein
LAQADSPVVAPNGLREAQECLPAGSRDDSPEKAFPDAPHCSQALLAAHSALPFALPA